MNMSLYERRRVELVTHKQASQPELYSVRSKRITESKCGKILIQKKKSVSLLRECLYYKHFVNPPKPIAWGDHFESVAVTKYYSLIKQAHLNALVEESGFVIHLDKGWLGASPDGLVKGVEATDGVLEVKCPYSKRDITPGEACSDKNFYCELHNSEIQLKTNSHIFMKSNCNFMWEQICMAGVTFVCILAKECQLNEFTLM